MVNINSLFLLINLTVLAFATATKTVDSRSTRSIFWQCPESNKNYKNKILDKTEKIDLKPETLQ